MDFLDQEADLPDETTIVDRDAGTKTPSEATAETKQKEQTPSSEENKEQDEDKLPFHKHPRWLQREQEFDRKLEKAVGETKTEYEARINALEEKFNPLLQSGEKLKPSAFFAKVFGDDPELYQEYLAEENAKAQRIRDETITAYEQRQTDARQAAEQEAKRWTDWVTTSVQGLKDKGETFDDNELKTIALKYKPTDDMGNIDFGLALEILKEKKAEEVKEESKKSNARKELAGSTQSSSRGESKAKDYLTHDDIRRRR